jgi:hypothetical protein
MSDAKLSDAAAFAELAAIYRQAEAELADRQCAACGACCRFRQYGHTLMCTSLEAAYLRHCCGAPPRPTDEEACGHLAERLCTARAGRPLACRTFLCLAPAGGETEARRQVHEAAHRRVATLCDRWVGGYRYGRLWEMA